MSVLKIPSRKKQLRLRNILRKIMWQRVILFVCFFAFTVDSKAAPYEFNQGNIAEKFNPKLHILKLFSFLSKFSREF
jgi:hypothetical protein